MATKAVTAARIGTYAFQYTSAALLNGDDSSPVDVTDLPDLTVQIPSSAVFGVGGTVIVEGSVDGSIYFPLKDPSSTAISFAAAGGKAVLEHTKLLRFRCTAGDGSTSIPCVLFARRVGR